MGKRGLGTGLFILSLALSFGPLVYAFLIHDWNYKPLVTPEPNPLEGIKGQPITVESYEYDNSMEWITIEFVLELPFSLRIDGVSMDLSCAEPSGLIIGSASLQDPVTITPGSTESITLDLDIDEQLMRQCSGPDVRPVNLTITINGIEIFVPSGGMGGMV